MTIKYARETRDHKPNLGYCRHDMFIPIGDQPNPNQPAFFTWLLIVINIAVFLFFSLPLMNQGVTANDPLLQEYLRALGDNHTSQFLLRQNISSYDLMIFRYGFRPNAPTLLSLLTSMFLHAGWMHLLGNMLFLWIFGNNVEYHLGRIRYLLLYLTTGALAALFHAALRYHSNIPLVGASGAISGVLGCYFIWFPHNRVRIFTFLFWYVDVILLPARWVLGFYLIVDNLLPFLVTANDGGVAHGAHIGGFLGGLLFAWLLTVLRKRKTFGRREKNLESKNQDQPLPDVFSQAITHYRYDEGLGYYARMTTAERKSLDPEVVLKLADYYTEQEQDEAALAVLQRLIAINPSDDTLARAHLRAGLILFHRKHKPTAAYQHFLTVLDLHPQSMVEKAARAGLLEIDQMRAPRRAPVH